MNVGQGFGTIVDCLDGWINKLMSDTIIKSMVGTIYELMDGAVSESLSFVYI